MSFKPPQLKQDLEQSVKRINTVLRFKSAGFAGVKEYTVNADYLVQYDKKSQRYIRAFEQSPNNSNIYTAIKDKNEEIAILIHLNRGSFLIHDPISEISAMFKSN